MLLNVLKEIPNLFFHVFTGIIFITMKARRPEELQRVKSRCIKEGKTKEADIFILPMDLTDFSTHEKLADKIVEKFGRIDYLINNAGRSQRVVVGNKWIELVNDKEKMELSEIVSLMNLNTFGTISVTKAALPHMLRANFGRIVVIRFIVGSFLLNK